MYGLSQGKESGSKKEKNMTIEALKAQRKKIDKQIRELEKGSWTAGNARLDHHSYPRGIEWYVAVKSQVGRDLGDSRWRAIITCKTKEEAISHIDDVINDLNALKAKLKEEGII